MKTLVQAIDLDDDPARIAEYLRHHERVWPEVARALRAIGIANMKIYRAGSRLVMVYQVPDGFDPARDFQRYARDPKAREWDALMRTYQRQIPGTPVGSWWLPMDEVFDLRRAAEAAGE